MLKQLDTLIGFAVVMSMVSLLITIVTQIASSLLGLRGKNLSDSLEAMLCKVDPDIDKQVAGMGKALADKALTHPLLSDSIISMSNDWPVVWKRATAIRPRELLAIFRQIAGQTPPPPGPPATAPEAAARLLRVLDIPTPAAQEAIDAIRSKLPELAAQHGREVVEHLASATNVALLNLEPWFDSAQDRARQWFVVHTRIVTIIASFLAAFVLQLDSFDLVRHLSSDPEVRAKLLAGVVPLNQQAQPLLADLNPVSPAALTNILAPLEVRYPGLTAAVGAPPHLSSLAELAPWLRTQLAATPLSNNLDNITREFGDLAQAASRKRLDDWSQQFRDLEARLNTSGVSIIPDPYPTPFGGAWSWPWPRLLGLVASAALLSLGAPFWFNLLKSLANLRPAVAQQIEKGQKTAPNPS
jgi:hypothetical protein